jgi:hypothetical protein
MTERSIDLAAHLVARMASKRQPPPAPYTAADPPVPQEQPNAQRIAEIVIKHFDPDGMMDRRLLAEILVQHGVRP